MVLWRLDIRDVTSIAVSPTRHPLKDQYIELNINVTHKGGLSSGRALSVQV